MFSFVYFCKYIMCYLVKCIIYFSVQFADRTQLKFVTDFTVKIDVDNLRHIQGLRDGDHGDELEDPDDLLKKYLKSIETVIDYVDKHKK